MDKIFEEVKVNLEKLNNCTYHNFIDITLDRKYLKKYQCENCKGILDSINVYYYNLGIKHQKEKDVIK